MSKRKRNGTTAWLITWDGASNVKIQERIAAVLNSRLAPATVKGIVELIYANAAYSLGERVEYARGTFNPFPAQYDDINGIRWAGRIICGHNPFLVAEKVDNLSVERDKSGREHATWTARTKPKIPFLNPLLGPTSHSADARR